MMKRSQTKKISAVLAAMAVLWGGGTLFFGGDSVSAAVDQAAVLKKVVESGKTEGLNEEEKTWFTSFFGGTTLQSGERALSSTDQVLTENEKKWVSNTYSRVNYDSDRRAIKFSTHEPIYLSSMSTTDIIMGNSMNVRMGSGNSTGQAQVYGGNNQFSAYTKVLGDDNIALGNYGITIGYQNDALGNTAIAIGQQSIAGVQWNGRDNKSTSGSNAIAVGTYSFANGNSSAIGRHSMAMGEYSTAFGTAAIAGKSDVVRYLNEVDLWHNYQPQYEELQKRYPEIFGVVTAENLYKNERYEDARNRIFNLYQDYFKSVGIDSLDKLKSQMRDSEVDSLLQDLGWQYALTFDNVIGPVAVGTGSKALANYALSSGYMSEAAQDGSVALGAWSKVTADYGVALGANARATEEDMVADGTKAPFSEITLSTKGTEVKGINEYLLGPVAIGGKQSGNTSAVYLRQLKYVADGTADTDAVNLRQLKAAVGNNGTTGGDNNGGSGNSGSSIVYEAGDNITITDGKNDHTKVISATGITDIKNQVTDLNGRVDKVEDSMNTMNHRITKLDRRVDKVGAGAAALAALHPLDFDPDNKWDIAGGYGHYAGQSAMALGAYYRPNEDVMFSIGGAFGNGEDMINAGVSVKVGSGESKTTTSKAAMAKKINELQDVVATQHQQLEEQKADMAKQDAKIAAQENEIQELKAMMQQILAK